MSGSWFQRDDVIVDQHFIARQRQNSRAPRPDGKDLLGVRGMRMHIVLPGEVFDLAARTPAGAAHR